MKFVRVLTAVLLMSAVLLFSVPVCADNSGSRLISGTFRCLPSDGGAVMEREFFWSDSYFSSSGRETNVHLRTFALDLALTSFGSYVPGDNAAYTKAILKDTGFSDIMVEQMDETATADSIGSVIAHKRTSYGEVIAVSVRGGYYGKEWENTLDIGTSGDLKGFSSAAMKIVERIKAYKNKYALSSPKLLLTGYSRGGAVCDLAGKYLNEDAAGYGFSADNLYIYTFEAPATSSNEPRYANIHNVCTDGDIVTMLFPAEWGMSHAGCAEHLDGHDIYIYRKHLEGSSVAEDHDIIYSDDTGYVKSVRSAPITVSEFEREFIGWFAANADRKLCASYSPCIARFVSLFASRTSYEAERLARYLVDVMRELYGSSLLSFRLLGLFNSSGDSYENSLSYLSSEFIRALDAKDYSTVMTNAEYAVLRADIPNLIRFAVPLIKADLTVTNQFSHISTFVGNMDAVFSHHRQEYVLPLTESFDNYYCPLPIEGAQIKIDETTAKVVSVELNGTVLREDVDYIYAIKDSAGVFIVPEVSGRYTAVITGVGEYSGTLEKSFTATLPHYHDWAFSSFGDAVSVRCTAPGCTDYTTGTVYSVKIIVSDKVYDGEEAKVGFVIDEGFPSEITVGRLRVYNEKGVEMSAVEPGRYKAELVISDRKTGAQAKADYEFAVSPKNIEKETVETVFEENSADIISVTCGGEKLSEETDYKVYYRDKDGIAIEKPENPGKYVAIISGEGRYTGKIRENFEIKYELNIPLTAALSAAVLAVAVGIPLIVHRIHKNTRP